MAVIPNNPNIGNFTEDAINTVAKTSSVGPSKDKTNPDTDVYSQLTGLSGWQGNVLNNIEQSTYHAQLFMVSDDPTALKSQSNYKSYDDYVAAIRSVNQTIIAESGVTTTNIAKFSIQTVAATNQATKSMAATNIKITIREPMTSSFLDLIADAASELKIRNLSKVPYFFQVSFMGYDTQGYVKSNPCGDFYNKGTWLYRLAIVDISVDSDYTGSTYVLNCIPYEENMYQESEMRLPNSISPQGATIGALLTDLCNKLNDSYVSMYGYGLRSYEVKFRTLENYNSEVPVDISKFKLMPLAADVNNKRSYPLQIDDKKQVSAHFERGVTLQSVVELAFANSEEAQQLAKDAPLNETDNKNVDTKARDCVTFRYDVLSENTGYDHLTEQYITHYTLVVAPYYTQRPILSDTQIKASADSKLQTANFNKLRKNNYLVKRYDYLFTGLNTEVISFDTKTNLKWSAVLPRVAGFRNSSDAETVHALRDTKDNLDKKQKDLLAKQDALDKYNSNKRKILDLQDDKDKNKKEIAERQAQQVEYQKVFGNEADLRNQANSLGADVEAFNKTQESQFTVKRMADQRYRFAEDVRDQNDLENDTLGTKDRSPVKVSLLQDTQDSRFLLSGAMPDFAHRDRALYGAVLDQIYAPLDKSMQSMSLYINGDPYWLGSANVERSWRIQNDHANGIPATVNGLSKSPTMPYYQNGDIMCMVTFKYPTGILENGAPQLKNNNFFTGVYLTKQVTHEFEAGLFKQRLDLLRMPLIDVFKAVGYVDSEEVKAAQNAHNKEIQDANKNSAADRGSA